MANQEEEGRESLNDQSEEAHPTLTVAMKEDERLVEEEKKEEQSRTNQPEPEEDKPLKDTKMEEENKGASSSLSTSLLRGGGELRLRQPSTTRRVVYSVPSYFICEDCKGVTEKIIYSTPGIISVSMDYELHRITVVGRFDAVSLASMLRKKTRRTEIITVRTVSKFSLLENKSVEGSIGDPTNGDYERYTSICLKSMPKLLKKKRMLIKWIFILLNVGLELCQAVFSQEAGDGKMKGSRYRKLGAIFSSICLTLSLLELVEEGKRDGVKWQRKRGCYCFRYPTKHGRIFGRFSLWFGLISAAMQFSVNIASLVLKRGILKFDHLGLLLSVGYFFAALGGEHATMVAKVRCSCHGSNQSEGKLVEGIWEFECPHCPPENRA